MKKVKYDNAPAAIEAVGNGSYLYRWGVEQIDSTNENQPQWQCFEVTIWNYPTQDIITERVIDALWGGGVEEKLINDYQAAQLGILDESFAAPYINLLSERKALKEQVEIDVTAWKSAT